jgi:hypothetical protein
MRDILVTGAMITTNDRAAKEGKQAGSVRQEVVIKSLQ